MLAVLALACNLGAGAGTPTDTPSAGQATTAPGGQPSTEPGGQPATEPGGQPTADPGGGPGSPAATIDLDDPALYDQPNLFNTYRTSMDYTFEAEGPVTGTVLLDSATQVEPYATTLQFYTFGNAVSGGETVYTFTQILDTQYAIIGGLGCQSGVPGIQENPFEVMLDAGGMLMGQAQYAGEGSANGVDTYIYTVTMDNIDPLDTAGQDVRSISNGEIHVARDGGYVVRLHLEGRGVNALLSNDPSLEGDVFYELNFFDFDAPVTIEVPAGCTPPGETAFDIPLPEDATDVSQISPDYLTFTTGESVEDVMEFYETEMPAHGCTLQSSTGSNDTGSAAMAFEGCDFGSVQIIILAESSDVTRVNILSGP
jgi:hypothetical protein